jgi:hypothetical protein
MVEIDNTQFMLYTKHDESIQIRDALIVLNIKFVQVVRELKSLSQELEIGRLGFSRGKRVNLSTVRYTTSGRRN